MSNHGEILEQLIELNRNLSLIAVALEKFVERGIKCHQLR